MTRKFATPIVAAALVALAGCAHGKGGHHHHRTPTLGERVPILVSENEADVDKTLAATAVTVPAPEANDSWTQSGGSADKSLGALMLGANPARLWTAQVAGGTEKERLGAAPVVAENKLFVIDTAATVHALAADTGRQLWTAALSPGKLNRASRFGGGVSYDDGKVFATDGLGDVVALNAADGKEVWRAKPGGPLRGAPTIANGNVYALSQDNQLFALDEGNGKVGWTESASLVSQGVFGVAAPASSQGTVVAGFSSGELNAYRYENGRTLWQDALSRTSITTSVSSLSDIDADPVIEAGRVYALGQGGRMVSIDLYTGQRLWEQNLAGISTPWIAGEWLFLVTDDARLVCMAAKTGKVRWIAQLDRYRHEKARKGAITWFGPVLAGGKLVLTNSMGEIVYRNPADGGDAGAAEVKGKTPFSLPPVVANSTLYVLDDKGRVTAFK